MIRCDAHRQPGVQPLGPRASRLRRRIRRASVARVGETRARARRGRHRTHAGCLGAPRASDGTARWPVCRGVQGRAPARAIVLGVEGDALLEEQWRRRGHQLWRWQSNRHGQGGDLQPDCRRSVRSGQKPPAHIAIPTTLSAGEFTAVAGITDEKTRVKRPVTDSRITPRTVIADPTLTLETPAWLWAASGIRALDHAIESIYSVRHYPVSDAAASSGLTMLLQHLRPSLDSDGRRACSSIGASASWRRGCACSA